MLYFWKKNYKQWGWKLGKKIKSLNHFFFIKITKMYNDKKKLEIVFGFMDILHINKQKENYISKNIYYKNKKN